jgi:hypothetical protein
MLIWSIKKILKLVRHSIILSLILYISFCISLFVYYLFYNWYLPKANFQRNVPFELNNIHYRQHNKDFIHSELISHVYLFDDNSETLYSGQVYTFTLHLELPESDLNFNIGIFGVTADIIDMDGQKLNSFKTIVRPNLEIDRFLYN